MRGESNWIFVIIFQVNLLATAESRARFFRNNSDGSHEAISVERSSNGI